jgi:hypothetical protein
VNHDPIGPELFGAWLLISFFIEALSLISPKLPERGQTLISILDLLTTVPIHVLFHMQPTGRLKQLQHEKPSLRSDVTGEEEEEAKGPLFLRRQFTENCVSALEAKRTEAMHAAGKGMAVHPSSPVSFHCLSSERVLTLLVVHTGKDTVFLF